MELEVLNKIYSNTVDRIIEMGVNNFYLYPREEFDEAQKGYRIDSDGNPIEDWIGDEYYIIGYDSCEGDPIIVNAKDERVPVYTMCHDDWSTLELIVDTYEEFINILKLIENTNLYDREECQNLLIQIYIQIPDEAHNYWTMLISGAYEFYTDNKFETNENNEYEAESNEEEFLI